MHSRFRCLVYSNYSAYTIEWKWIEQFELNEKRED